MHSLLNDPILPCPKCGAEIRLTESLTAPIFQEAKKQYDEKLAEQQKTLRDREQHLSDEEAAIVKKSAGLDAEVQSRLKLERDRIAKEESKRARLEFGNQMRERQQEVDELERVLAERDKKLEEARKEQLEFKRKERELEDQRRAIEVTVESRVNESLGEIRFKAQKEAEGKLKLKITEKEETIASMQRQIEDLKRKAEQGSLSLPAQNVSLS